MFNLQNKNNPVYTVEVLTGDVKTPFFVTEQGKCYGSHQITKKGIPSEKSKGVTLGIEKDASRPYLLHPLWAFHGTHAELNHKREDEATEMRRQIEALEKEVEIRKVELMNLYALNPTALDMANRNSKTIINPAKS